MPDCYNQLDNPAWHALTSVQQSFASGLAHVKRYQRGILPFAAWEHRQEAALPALRELLHPGEHFFLIGELPPLPSFFTIQRELPCLQMVLEKPIELPPPAFTIEALNPSHSEAMFNLINEVQHGYYEKETWRLGNYYGIWQNDRLVAVAGERMKMNGLSEISAVCTDAAYTGRQYAQYLVAHLCNTNLQNGITPFLHVLETNDRAIRLYAYLGFVVRRKITFWHLQNS